VAADRDLRNEQSATTFSSAAANPPVKREEMQGSEIVAGVSAPSSPPGANVEQEKPRSEGRRSYIVHLASFRDEEDAEKLQRRLLKKGFDAVIRAIDYQGVGRLYAVQLKPVDSADKANQLLMEVQKVRRGKLKIIEEPAN
jgi:cell division septation protein DedD